MGPSAREKVFFQRALSPGSGLAPLLTLGGEQLEDQQRDSDDDEAVGEVEVGPRVAAPELDVQEVDDFTAATGDRSSCRPRPRG